MIYADTDFFIALLKPKDRLKDKAKRAFERYKGQITTSEVTFIELALLAKRYNLDVVKLITSVMAICGIEEDTYLKAAIYMRDYGVGVFDAFHAAHCGDTIISSDHIFDKIGIKRIRLEDF
ncbi:pilus assembly protein [Archaeoglobales archaeon]|nr:MAG: pilus assembly protein [Archaeoglobales archaeon]